jgi:hypothetical protein
MGAALEFRHVDVFAHVPFTGNGLIVLFGSTAGFGAEELISVTVEMRQFELILADFEPETGRVPAGRCALRGRAWARRRRSARVAADAGRLYRLAVSDRAGCLRDWTARGS